MWVLLGKVISGKRNLVQSQQPQREVFTTTRKRLSRSSASFFSSGRVRSCELEHQLRAPPSDGRKTPITATLPAATASRNDGWGLLNNTVGGLAGVLTRHGADQALRQLRGHHRRQDVLHQVTDEAVRHLTGLKGLGLMQHRVVTEEPSR